MDINGKINSAATADVIVVFMGRVIGGQPQLNGCKGNTASKSDNGLSLTQCALAILLNRLAIDCPLNLFDLTQDRLLANGANLREVA